MTKDDDFKEQPPGATILSFPAPGRPTPPSEEPAAVDPADVAEMADDLGVAATNMVAIQASIINMLAQQMRQLHRRLPEVVDGLTRRPASELIARHWAEAAEGQIRFLSSLVEVMDKTAVTINPELHASVARSAMRLRSLIEECRRPSDERAILFGSASYLRRRVCEETAILDRNMTAFDAAARAAAGLD